METQIKLLNKAYVESQVRELKEIKKKELKFDVTESDRAFSRTLYVNFYWQGLDSKWLKGCSLRISNHSIPDCVHAEFIIDTDGFLSKKVKEKFKRALEQVVRNTKWKMLHKTIDEFERRRDEKA